MVRTSMISSSARKRLIGALLASITGLFLLPSIALVIGQDGDGADSRMLGDKKCFFCHRDMKESFPLSIHGPLATGEDSTACESCHGSGREHVESAGDVESIVRFGELTPKDATTRCLTCHEKTAGDGHVKGFLASKWLTEGKSCVTCHEAHGPAHGVAAAAVARAEPLTPEACLVCHSDRVEMVAFSHRERTAELRGCETCHGSGYEHAMSRGAPGTILDLKTAPAKRADKSCALCHQDMQGHQDMQAPDHFKPSPGKERCVDCHGIHTPPPMPAAGVAETPGRPEFKLETADSGEATEIAPFRVEPLPVTGAGGYDLIGMKFTGDIKLGYRSTDVDGNENVYRQRQDYRSGFRLFDLSLGGKALGDSDAEFYLSATGVGDPVENYRLSISDGEYFDFSIDGQRTDFSYAALGDPRNWGAKRSAWGFELTLFPKAPVRVSLGFDYDTRDGDFLGNRLITGSITPTAEPFEETGNYAYVRIDWDAGPVNLSLTQGYRWDDLTEEIFGQVDADTGLNHRIDTDVTAPLTTFMATAKASPELLFDTKFVYSPIDTDTKVRSSTFGLGSGNNLTFEESEKVNGNRDYFRGELGATWFAASDLSFTARAEYFSSDQDVDGNIITDIRSDSGGVTDIERENPETSREQSRWRLFAEANYRPVDWGAFRLGYEWATDDVKITIDGDKFDEDSQIQGPVFGFDLDPMKELSIDFLYRFMRNDNPMTEIGSQDKDQARLKIRFKPEETMFFTVFGTQQRITNTRHDTDIMSWAAGFNAHFEPMNGLTFDAGYDYQYYDTETEVVRFIDGVSTFGMSRFRSRTNGISLFAGWEATPGLHFDLGAYWSLSTGDYPVDVINLWIGAEYEFVKSASVGTELRWNSYEEKDLRANDYDAYIWEIWLRYRF